MTQQYCLPKFKRMCEQQQIKSVFSDANAVYCPGLVLLGRANGLHYSRLAVIVAKKNVKKAVKRNLLKRLIRESFRLNQHALAGNDFIVIVKKPLAEEVNTQVLAILEKQWKRYLKRHSN